MKSSLSTSTPFPEAIAPTCVHLRKKEMYYERFGDAAEDGDFASDACWCSKTQEPFGPDGESAGKITCRPGRTCYTG